MSDAVYGDRRKPRPETRRNSNVRHLRRRGPATKRELPKDINSSIRHGYVGKLYVRKGNARKSRGRVTPVYYLYGDERRAVRKFIQVNHEFVESCMQDNANTLNMRLDDVLWQMFLEEWVWGEHGDEYK